MKDFIAIHAKDKKVQQELENAHLTFERDGVVYVYVRDIEYNEHMEDVLDELEAQYGEFDWKVFGM